MRLNLLVRTRKAMKLRMESIQDTTNLIITIIMMSMTKHMPRMEFLMEMMNSKTLRKRKEVNTTQLANVEASAEVLEVAEAVITKATLKKIIKDKLKGNINPLYTRKRLTLRNQNPMSQRKRRKCL